MKRKLLSVAVLVTALFTLNSFKSSSFITEAALITDAGVKICPGSGASCILWGLVYKGSDNSHIELIEDKPIKVIETPK